ncbi:MAG TPA: helix-turn-helix domain-containing protein, partial [Bacillota bacterium]|nr:helix-turn-helix domain-containing protein [Bacillota bacterium]
GTEPSPENPKKDSRLIEALKDYLNSHYQEALTLSKIAETFSVNPNYLCERFKQQTGEHFVTYLTRLRIEQAKLLLEDVTVRAYEVGFRVGYDDPTYFSKVFKKVVGLTPTEYRQNLP